MCDHDDNDDQEHGSELPKIELRVKAQESILAERGYADPAALDVIVETYEPRSGPATAPASWYGPGAIPAISSASAGMRPRLSRNSASADARASIW